MPSIRFEVEPKKLGRFERKLIKYFRETNLNILMNRAGDDMVSWLIQNSQGVFYKGDYRTGWYSDVKRGVLMVGNRSKHFVYVEKGRRAGAAMPPHPPILEWVLDHGMQANAAFPVRRSISRRGIRARPLLLLDTTHQLFAKMFHRRCGRFIDRVLMEAAK